MDFSDEDRQQFAQLIGYSVSGYGELSNYVSDEEWERVNNIQAVAQAHDEKMKREGAAKALEEVRQHVLTTMHYTQTWNQQTVLQVIGNAQLRATSKKAG